MMRTSLAGLALALVAVLGSNAQAQNANDKNNNNANRNNNERDAGKQETVRGVIAGVTVSGETAIDYATHRAATVEMTYLTVVGSPVRDSNAQDRDRDRDNARNNADRNNADRNRDNANNSNNSAENNRRRHNVYVIWLTPRTEVRDASSHEGNANNNANANNNDRNQRDAQGKTASLDTLEVGDTVRVTFTRREFSQSGGQNQNQAQASKHGRHRTYFGDANSVTILAEPNRQRDGNRASSNDRDRDRDDDKDKVKNTNNNSNENKDKK